MAGPFATKEFLGYFGFYKTAGQTSPGPALTTQTTIPIISWDPRNPLNNAYAGVVNKSAGPSVVTRGMHTPSMSMGTCLKASWATALLINDMIGGSASYLDANLDTSEYSAGFYEPVLNVTRVYSGVHFMAMRFGYSAAGGPISFMASGPCIYGDSEGSPVTFASESIDPGATYNTSDVTLTGADQVRSCVIDIMHGQGYQFFSNQTLYAAAITSGMIGGQLTIEQSPTYSSTPSSSFTMQVGPATTGIKLTCNINLDEAVRSVTLANGNIAKVYSLINLASGGYPVVIAAGT